MIDVYMIVYVVVYVVDKCVLLSCICVFFFKQKTAYEMRISDWSSDVCSSDLGGGADLAQRNVAEQLAETVDVLVQQRLYRLRGVVAGGETEIGRASCRERVCQYV